jgi:MinD-like ATPase involved in chromosome partitioning or flagellar assembly
MSTERFVVLGLAHVRAGWFAELSRWSTSGVVPIEFVKCVSVDEVRSRLLGAHAVSAVLVDARRTGVDRDLLAAARDAGAAAIVVGDDLRDWTALGATAQLPTQFSRRELVDTLDSCASPISRTELRVEHRAPIVDGAWRGSLVAVTGPGGTGASTVAMALAQAMANDAQNLGLVLLADLALDADLAMLHDARDVVPGVQELVDAFRSGALEPEGVRALTFDVVDRGYHLLLGLRNHRDWTAIRPRAFDAALDAMRQTFRVVVADIDHDVEGQERTGSLEVEDRNVLARTCTANADLVVVVGQPGTKGLHALVRCVHQLLEHGVGGERIVPMFNRVGHTVRHRAELSRAFAYLTDAGQRNALASPLFLAERRGLDSLITQAAPLPRSLTRPIGNAISALLDQQETLEPTSSDEPQRVAVGSLGTRFETNDDGLTS